MYMLHVKGYLVFLFVFVCECACVRARASFADSRYTLNRAMTCPQFDAAFWRISCAAASPIWDFRNSCLGHSRWSKDLIIYLSIYIYIYMGTQPLHPPGGPPPPTFSHYILESGWMDWRYSFAEINTFFFPSFLFFLSFLIHFVVEDQINFIMPLLIIDMIDISKT